MKYNIDIDELTPFFKNIEEIEINKIEKNNDSYRIVCTDESFCSTSLNKIAGKIKYIINHDNTGFLSIYINTKTIADTPVITTLSYILYYTFLNSSLTIKLNFISKNTKFNYNYFKDSILFELNNKEITREEYLNSFHKSKVSLSQFREFIYNDNSRNVKSNKLYTDLSSFFNHAGHEDKEYIDDLCEAISELVSNALEHGESDCLLEISCHDGIIKSQSKHKITAIVVSNVSHKFIYSDLSTNHKNNIIVNKDIDIAKDYHKKYITDYKTDYSEDDFYTVSTFQKGVSSRINQKNCGGTGLYLTISHILEQTTLDYCYLLTGDRVIEFNQQYLTPSNGYIGFNKENSYLKGIPDSKILDHSNMFFNGTMIYLLLGNRKDDIDE